jgi:tetratricopeptide (TPR) repeat protein
MLKKILALTAIALLAPALAQPQEPALPPVRGTSGSDDTKAANDSYLLNYGGSKGRHEAAVAAFQAAYEAARTQRRDRAMRLFLVSLRREAMAKALYNLGILCAHDERWEDALNFQREAQQQTADPEVAKLAAQEIERLRAVMDLESTPAGQQQRAFDIQFIQVLNKAKAPFAALGDLKEIVKRYNTRWEAPALEGMLYADPEVHNFPESLKAFEAAVALAPPDRRQHLRDAAELARGEATFNEQRISADELWEKQQYESAAKHYRQAWESSPEHLDVALKAATGFLMADKVDLAVQILSGMRVSATVEMDARIEAMLKELGAISDEAKIRAAGASGTSAGPSNVDTAARMRTLVGRLTTRQMELAAKSDPPLIDEKTNVSHVPDDELTGASSNLPLLSGDSIYALYKRDRPASSAPPAGSEPANPASPAAPAAPGLAPPASAKPAPLADLPPALPPLPSAEPARPLTVARHVPGELDVPVSSDPPGALVTFGDDGNLNCTAPCQVALSAGRHPWRATLSGYRDTLGVFNIERGKKPPAVVVSLEAKRGFVSVESKIAGLPIFLNGRKTDNRTPTNLKLMEGGYQVAVEIDGKLATQDISVHDGALMKVTF